ncbi:MAG: isoprenylcysteine carboxylmethyltransferase family protein [Candidatus Wallbacteria bacterium]|nr:isoprenylcysteine carboxylmethyltransferase family protein [Candidatus Wallbacteria bacterium]
MQEFQKLNWIRKFLGLLLALAIVFEKRCRFRPAFLGLIVSGLGIRIWAAGSINKNADLAVKGPYSLTRNPLYFGSFLLGTGFAGLVLPLPGLIASSIVFPLIYWPKMLQEERDLERFFPDSFEEYRQRVPLFFPRICGYIRGEFSLKKALCSNREYNSALAALLLLLIIRWKRRDQSA